MKDTIVVEGNLRKRWNECIVDILRFYVELCKKHNLRYFIAYGTAIGAIRHQGIIPWDDDIDVLMPRPDYERLVEICEKSDLGKYKLLTRDNTPNYYLSFSKMCNMETTLLESKEYHCVLGLFIDIFVLDGITDDLEEANRLATMYKKYCNRFVLTSSYYPWSKVKAKLSKGEIKDLVHYWLLCMNRKNQRKRFLAKLHEIENAYDYEQCNSVVNLLFRPRYADTGIFPKEWMEGTETFTFEGMTVDIQSGYDHILRQHYGDYMQLPPEEERHSRHHIAYVNLEKRESYEEVMKKLRE